MDLVKYRNLFLEESSDHLAEMSRALLVLEKDPTNGEAIDEVFRMAHSIKGMAGSLGYDAVTELAHKLEDRMDRIRAEGRVEPGEQGTPLLFKGLEGLERMVAQVRETGEAPPPDLPLVALLDARAAPPVQGDGTRGAPEPQPKKVPTP